MKAELDSGAAVDDRLKVSALHKEHLSSIHKKNVTSDYESCNESPSSSDHSDNILTSDEMSSGSPPKKVINRMVSIISLCASDTMFCINIELCHEKTCLRGF